MANYIQGAAQDYIPQIQPFRPDFNFYAYALQTKQSQYDANYQKLSSIYGTLLNSPMLRDKNNERRMEFFKAAETNVQKMSGIDLSLQENVDAAYNVFKPFYEDKNMMKDISWTREYQKQLERADNFRNCLDPKKCGGKYWDTGVMALNYKADEFRTASDEDALGFTNPKFTPYIDVMEKAMTLAKESGLSIKRDDVSGQWITTTKNGQQIVGPLYSLFAGSIGSDPAVQEMYQTQAYADRKNYAKQNAFMHGSEEAAESYYINGILASSKGQVQQTRQELGRSMDEMRQRKTDLERKSIEEGLTLSEQFTYENLQSNIDETGVAHDQYETLGNVIDNGLDGVSMNVLRSRADMVAASGLLQRDLLGAAEIMSHRDEEFSIKENPYALASHQSSLALRNSMAMADKQHQYNMIEEEFKSGLRIKEQKEKDLGMIVPKMPTPIEGAPWADVVLEDEGSNVLYNQNINITKDAQAVSRSKMMKFLGDAYTLAGNVADRPGAKTMLEKTYGRKWDQFDMDALKKMPMKDLAQMYNTARAAMDQKSDNKDVMWASDFMNARAKDMSDIDIARQEAVATNKRNAELNAKVVKNLRAGTTAVDKDADLILTKNKYITSKEDFMNKWKDRHAGEDAYREKRYLPMSKEAYEYKTYTDRDINDDAESAWEYLHTRFLTEYNNQQQSAITGRGELGGFGGNSRATPIFIPGLDAREKGEPQKENVKATIMNIVTDIPQGDWSVAFGNPTSDNFGNVDDALKPLISKFLTDISTPNKAEDRPVFNVIHSNVAANDPSMSGLTVQLTNGKYVANLVGTKEKPGPLYGVRDQFVANPTFTVFYKHDKANNPFRAQATQKPLDNIIKSGGLVYDKFDQGGYLKTTEDGGEYVVQGYFNMYRGGVMEKAPFVDRYPRNTTDYETVHNQLQFYLEQMHNQNIELSKQAALFNKRPLP